MGGVARGINKVAKRVNGTTAEHSALRHSVNYRNEWTSGILDTSGLRRVVAQVFVVVRWNTLPREVCGGGRQG